MKDKITIKNSWESLSIGEFSEMDQILRADIPEHYKTVNLVSVLTGLSVNEVENLPITVFQKLARETQFITQAPPSVTHKDEYELNGRKYVVKADLTQITTAQYIDYQEYMKEPNNYIKMMSVWLIPEGHKYGDGYDVNQVISDIETMNFLDFKSLAFFFRMQFATLILLMADCSVKKEKKMSKDMKDSIITHYHNMASFLLSSGL